MPELTPFDEGFAEQEARKLAAKAAEAAAQPAPEASVPKTAAAPKTKTRAAPSSPPPAGDDDDDPFRIDFDLGDARERKATEDFDREKWGIFPDMDPAFYYADPCPDVSISQSGIRKLLGETPKDFAFSNPRLNKDGGADIIKSTMQSRRGDIVHQLVLGKGKGYRVGDFKTWQSNDSKAFKAECEEAGEVPILRHQFREAKAIAEVVREKIRRLLDGADYQTEVAFMFQVMTPFGPIWVRGLMDIWCEELGIILDPKITPRIYARVPSHMVDMGWDIQAALYKHAIGVLKPDLAGRVKFADLMVKPEAPFTSRLVGADKPWEWSSWHECERAFNLFASCLYHNQWDGFPENRVELMECPVWEAKRREEIQTREPVK